MLFDQNMIIDATRGSIARFVNHSCEPNCRMEKWTVGGKPRMALFAGDKGIMTGDELTYDYNFDPFSQKNVQECRCRSSKCRGVLGPKPRDERQSSGEKQTGSSAASKLAGAKRKIAEIVHEGTERLSKKAKITVSDPAVLKKDTVTNPKSKTPAAARRSTQSGTARAALVKRPALRATSLTTRGPITRRPSALKRIANVMNGATEKPSTRRSVSSSSASDALLKDETKQGQPLTRKDSMKNKAASIRRSVVRTVRGARSGSERILRPVLLEHTD